MKFFKGLPTLAVSIMCLVLISLQLIYTMSIYGFSHLNTQFILNTLFGFALFIGAIIITVLFVSLTVIYYVLKKLDILEGRFKDNLSNFTKTISEIKSSKNN